MSGKRDARRGARATSARGGRAVTSHVADLLPSHALGILEPGEQARVSDHLARCAACRSELKGYEAVVDQLLQSTPREEPPAGLEQSILARIGVPAAGIRPHGLRLVAERAKRVVSSRAFTALAAAACLVIAVALAVISAGLSREVRHLSAEARTAPQIVAVLTGTGAAPAGGGVLLAGRDLQSGTLVVRGLSALEPAYQYQLWLIRDGARISGGLFSVAADGRGFLAVSAPRRLTDYSAFGITIEPAGGSPGPTGTKVLGGTL